ncbi:hypothetical protein AMAG_16008 [Allomyces macrogynus ATCC 38327]|uniref:Uncharacterized protein n=1 Tax=Allomyces macrogynus (strain ATCC 38327) TaxID=578462 RepID=A0A0L0TBJ5_ALLM3|nr:hypothetical protein AMAG_16008 [Allomyces macrogynus ATCC 38327]|eukprot:KNE72070.1 hypothetical protein AMAG_16008 [Allomyces macrogynus ATCC 38327]
MPPTLRARDDKDGAAAYFLGQSRPSFLTVDNGLGSASDVARARFGDLVASAPYVFALCRPDLGPAACIPRYADAYATCARAQCSVSVDAIASAVTAFSGRSSTQSASTVMTAARDESTACGRNVQRTDPLLNGLGLATAPALVGNAPEVSLGKSSEPDVELAKRWATTNGTAPKNKGQVGACMMAAPRGTTCDASLMHFSGNGAVRVMADTPRLLSFVYPNLPAAVVPKIGTFPTTFDLLAPTNYFLATATCTRNGQIVPAAAYPDAKCTADADCLPRPRSPLRDTDLTTFHATPVMIPPPSSPLMDALMLVPAMLIILVMIIILGRRHYLAALETQAPAELPARCTDSGRRLLGDLGPSVASLSGPWQWYWGGAIPPPDLAAAAAGADHDESQRQHRAVTRAARRMLSEHDPPTPVLPRYEALMRSVTGNSLTALRTLYARAAQHGVVAPASVVAGESDALVPDESDASCPFDAVVMEAPPPSYGDHDSHVLVTARSLEHITSASASSVDETDGEATGRLVPR